MTAEPITIRVSSEGARVYVIRGPGKFDWTVATLHDETGLVAIVSDHGNWAHAWNPRHIGEPTLHHFVVRADADYAAGKMLHAKDREELDVEGTRRQIFERIIRDRRETRIGKEVARERWDEIVDWDEQDYHEHILPGDEWLSEAYEYIAYRPTATAKAFMEIVWPGVQRAVREELARREEGAEQP